MYPKTTILIVLVRPSTDSTLKIKREFYAVNQQEYDSRQSAILEGLFRDYWDWEIEDMFVYDNQQV